MPWGAHSRWRLVHSAQASRASFASSSLQYGVGTQQLSDLCRKGAREALQGSRSQCSASELLFILCTVRLLEGYS